jgi:hypothetical protein
MGGVVKFTVTPAPVFEAQVLLSRPGGDPVRVTFSFRHKARSQIEAWNERLSKEPESAIEEIVAGWGEEMDRPFSSAALTELLDNYYNAATEILIGYRDGLREAREKN